MEKIYSALLGLLLIVTVSWPRQANAQGSQTMSYKLVLRESKNSSLNNLQIGIKIVTLQSSDNGKRGYVEIQSITGVEASIFEPIILLLTRFFTDIGSLLAEICTSSNFKHII